MLNIQMLFNDKFFILVYFLIHIKQHASHQNALFKLEDPTIMSILEQDIHHQNFMSKQIL